MKKIELEQKIKELEWERDGLEKANNRIKKEFAKAFDWYTAPQELGYSRPSDKTYEVPSWQQIFVEIGKLLTHKSINRIEEMTITTERNLDRFVTRVEEVEEAVKKLTNK